jgi:hypothetical protein
MNKLKWIVLCVILITCSCGIEKSTEYWLQPENQNGIIINFFASDEYCIEAIRTSLEFKESNRIDSTISALISNSEVDSLSVGLDKHQAIKSLLKLRSEVYFQLAILKEELVEANGGYCAPDSWDYTKDFPLFPILPYRTVTNKKFWSENRNRNKIKDALLKFDSGLNSLGQPYGYQEDIKTLRSTFPAMSSITEGQIIDNLLLENTTVGAILTLKLIQLNAVEKMIRFQNHILNL